MQELVGNLGEWSEPYAMIKIVGDGYIQEGDSKYEKLNSKHLIRSLIKQQRKGNLTIDLNEAEFAIIKYNGEQKKVSLESFEKNASKLFEHLINCKKGKSTKNINLPEMSPFFDDILIDSLKAYVPSKKKTATNADLTLKIVDHRTSKEQERGFSVKSQLGAPSHLLNHSGRNTCFGFLLKGFTESHFSEFNSKQWGKKKVIEKVKFLNDLERKNYITIEPKNYPEGDIFKRNLMLVDDATSAILSEFLWQSYLSAKFCVSDVVPMIVASDPRKYGEGFNLENIYEKKLKRFLVECSMGLTGATEWDGNYQSSGGYIVVLETGDIISYHIFDKEGFEEFLFKNVKQDTPSSKNEKGKFGNVYRDGSEYVFYLNLSLRFRK